MLNASRALWPHPVDWLNPGDSYHPAAAGQSGGYAQAFAGAAR